MLNAIGQTIYIKNYTPKRPERVAPLEFTPDMSDYKGQLAPRECCIAQWEDMVEVARYRKTKLIKCPVCGIHYTVAYRLQEVYA